MKYSIIIPTHNQCDQLLKPCVESVLAHTHMDQVQLIICAYGCVDNTSYYVQRLQNQFIRLGFGDHFEVITHDVPLTFVEACNMGIRAAQADKIVILNHDCVLEPQPRDMWLNLLHAPFESNHQVGITYTQVATLLGIMIDRNVIHKVGIWNHSTPHNHDALRHYCLLTEQAGFSVVNVNEDRHVPTHVVQQTPVTPLLTTPEQVAASYAWLAHVNAESPALFKEVIETNTYKLQPSHLVNRSVIDVGANMGMFSIMCAAMGCTDVWACEPVLHTHEQLTQNVLRAQLDDHITCVRSAIVGKSLGPIMMGTHADSGKNSLYDMGVQAELVPSQTLAQIVNSCAHEQILLKMDCEGAEYDILLDSENHVFDRVHMIMMETHGDTHPIHKGIPLLHDRLRALGFTQLDYQPYGIWWHDASGAAVSWEPMNMSIELWSK